MYILGISISHNSSAALMRGGEIVSACCEERFTKTKNYIGFPKQSIDYILRKEGILGSDLDNVVFTTVNNSGIYVKSKNSTSFNLQDYYDYYGPKYFGKRMKGEDTLDYKKWLRDDIKFNQDVEYLDFKFLTDEVLSDPVKDEELFADKCCEFLIETWGVESRKIVFADHHTCHANYAYFGSPFRDKACIAVTLDGWGDGRNQTVWEIKNNDLNLLADSDQNDLGRIYKFATLLLGMRPDEHEFKVMGMAPYAKESYVEKAKSVIKDISDVKGLKIVSKNRPPDLLSYLEREWKFHRFDNIAGAVQLYTEEIVSKLFTNIYEETGIKRFVISGGIAMNIKMNKVLGELDTVEEFFVCGSGGDESLAIGGCYFINAEKSKPLDHLYLGYDAEDDISNLETIIKDKNFRIISDPGNELVASLLKDGDIVGLIDGKAEFGARALGNRSILANPSLKGSVQRINEAIKNRDFWMPFALSILDEVHEEYISNPKNFSSPFMAIGLDSKKSTYESIQAGTHPYDRSVRPQFVRKDANLNYHSLIDEFYRISGIPALLNTSFNLHGEPIVNNINDAVRTFELSGLDHLFICNKFLLSKN
tara:strand:+ start:14381 stop:16156 length:1776 start_codon:yes stop_codon:yes gene_type:complete